MKTSESQLRAVAAYSKKCTSHLIRINPKTEPLIASRLAALKKSGKATAFFKDALRDLQEMDA